MAVTVTAAAAAAAAAARTRERGQGKEQGGTRGQPPSSPTRVGNSKRTGSVYAASVPNLADQVTKDTWWIMNIEMGPNVLSGPQPGGSTPLRQRERTRPRCAVKPVNRNATKIDRIGPVRTRAGAVRIGLTGPTERDNTGRRPAGLLSTPSGVPETRFMSTGRERRGGPE